MILLLQRYIDVLIGGKNLEVGNCKNSDRISDTFVILVLILTKKHLILKDAIPFQFRFLRQLSFSSIFKEEANVCA